MRVTTIVAFGLMLSLYAHSQTTTARQRHQTNRNAQAQCTFLDGKTITAIPSSEDVRTLTLVTDENLVTDKQINVPAGSNTISAVTDFHDNWTLIVRQQDGKKKFLELAPKFVRKLASSDEAGGISFVQGGGSCSMLWNLETSNTLITLIFREKNAVLPVSP